MMYEKVLRLYAKAQDIIAKRVGKTLPISVILKSGKVVETKYAFLDANNQGAFYLSDKDNNKIIPYTDIEITSFIALADEYKKNL